MKDYIKLNNGQNIPILGLGTWKSTPHTVGDAIKYAITKAGYRHIDCARIYRNEPEIGLVLKEIIGKKVSRDSIFITSKLWNTDHNPKKVEQACKQTLLDLKLDFLDLYLMHWGVSFRSETDLDPLYIDGKIVLDEIAIAQTWAAMEQLVKRGLVKSIGVSNFNTPMLIDLLASSKIKPAVNQIELHPYLTQEQLVSFCNDKEIAVTAYSPLGRPGESTGVENLMDETVIKKLSKKYQKSAAQILLNWAIRRGTIVIPKSVTPGRIKENIDIFDFELTDVELEEVSKLNRNLRIVNPGAVWGIPYFS